MKELEHWMEGINQDHENALILSRGHTDRVISIRIDECGMVEFRENCDGFFFAEFSKDEAINALNEAIEWIKKN